MFSKSFLFVFFCFVTKTYLQLFIVFLGYVILRSRISVCHGIQGGLVAGFERRRFAFFLGFPLRFDMSLTFDDGCHDDNKIRATFSDINSSTDGNSLPFRKSGAELFKGPYSPAKFGINCASRTNTNHCNKHPVRTCSVL